MEHGSPGSPTAPSPAPSGVPRGRIGRLVAEVAKFGAVGGVGVLVNLLVFNLVRHVSDLPVVRASVIATIVAIVFNYLGFRYFTYRDREKGHRTREMSLFLLFSVVGLVIENGVLYTATYGFGWDTPLQSNIFKFLGIGLGTLFRFWSYRTWVFRALPSPEAAVRTAPEQARATALHPQPSARAARPAGATGLGASRRQ
ncbi:GtrA family protein [Streptomyces tagetis]|uniref:GtrA family protein n=1 Tax=Streptomyces tagetis TaxID=2820809 RepID=A0A941B4T7_9ACTN|nr:GtrA family protein [Streptomyces sp. RG38]MBQ0829557.1 GtrA family protein [Streptomyces sp. RG38]